MEFSAENSQLGAGLECVAAPEAFPGAVTPSNYGQGTVPRTRQSGTGSLETPSLLTAAFEDRLLLERTLKDVNDAGSTVPLQILAR